MRPPVHMIWIGPKPFPYQRNFSTFRQKKYPITLWTEPPPDLINISAYNAMRSYAGKADILRLELLYRYGGLYSDADSYMLTPIALKHNLITMTSASGYCGNETMYATKGHPALLEAIEGLEANVRALAKSTAPCHLWDFAGATYLTPIFQKYGVYKWPRRTVGPHKWRSPYMSIAHRYSGTWAYGIRKSQRQPSAFWIDRSKL